MIGVIHKIFAGRNSNEDSGKVIRELGYKMLLWEARILEVDEEQIKLAIGQAMRTEKLMMKSVLKILVMMLKSTTGLNG